MTASATTSLKLDADIKARVQRLAEARRRSPHWLLREAVAQYVAREEAMDRLRDDVQAAWADYQANGLHLTGEEADAWLTKLEAGEDCTPPECHG